MIEVRPEGYIDEPGSDITINGIRSRFGYTTISKIRAAFGGRSAGSFCVSGGGAAPPDRLISLAKFAYRVW